MTTSFKQYITEVRAIRSGDSYFDSTALHLAKNPPKYDINARHPGLNPDYDKVIHMHPKDFLAVSRSGHDPEKHKRVTNLVSSGTKFNEIPELHFTHDGEGFGRVSGHEGRHRARSLLDAGVTKMPVILRQRYNSDVPPLKWTQKYSGTEPHTLQGEISPYVDKDDHSKNTIPFPK